MAIQLEWITGWYTSQAATPHIAVDKPKLASLEWCTNQRVAQSSLSAVRPALKVHRAAAMCMCAFKL